MIHGIVNVLKPSAMSSHDVVGRVRHIFGMKKVGHAGTLDPLAAGVLPVFSVRQHALSSTAAMTTRPIVPSSYSVLRRIRKIIRER